VNWALWAMLAMFALCFYAVIYEFMLSPMRVTTIQPQQRQVVVHETAP